MIKAVFFDFYNTLGVWGRSLKPRVQEIAARYGIEIDLERYATARENLYSDASGSDPTVHDLLENMQQIVNSYRDFLRELGVQDYLDQMTWELLQSEHSLFAATNAILYEDTIPTLEHLRGEGFKLAIVSNWDTPLDPLTERLGIAALFRYNCCFPRYTCPVRKTRFAYLQLHACGGWRFGSGNRPCWGYL